MPLMMIIDELRALRGQGVKVEIDADGRVKLRGPTEAHVAAAKRLLGLLAAELLTGDAQPDEVGETTTAGRCWRCNADLGGPPSLDDQVAILRSLHDARPELFLFRDTEWKNLRRLLLEKDILAVVRNVVQRADPKLRRCTRVARRALDHDRPARATRCVGKNPETGRDVRMDISSQAPHERFAAAHAALRGLLAEMNDGFNIDRIDRAAKRIASLPDDAPEVFAAIEVFESSFLKLVRISN
jgi:hypothetical protein